MRNSMALLTLTGVLSATVSACRFVSTALAQCGAGANAYGVARTEGVAGDAVPIDVLGTAIVESGAAIAAGAAVEADASGRAITHDAGVVLGRLAPGESAAASGQLVEVILISN